ncbi:unnamed protein product [Rotaria sp. Silwood2]|nr:unnamed protein product [Rotaria sp. Silwood2]
MSLSGDNNVVHRTGALKQQNKPFRTGRYRFQHEIKRRTKDQVAEKKHARSLKRLNVTNKQNRINTAIHGVPQLTMCDTIIYVISSLHGISNEEDYLFDLINVHCLPGSIIYTVV